MTNCSIRRNSGEFCNRAAHSFVPHSSIMFDLAVLDPPNHTSIFAQMGNVLAEVPVDRTGQEAALQLLQGRRITLSEEAHERVAGIGIGVADRCQPHARLAPRRFEFENTRHPAIAFPMWKSLRGFDRAKYQQSARNSGYKALLDYAGAARSICNIVARLEHISVRCRYPRHRHCPGHPALRRRNRRPDVGNCTVHEGLVNHRSRFVRFTVNGNMHGLRRVGDHWQSERDSQDSESGGGAVHSR